MSDICSRNSISTPQMIADALLRNLTGTNAQFRLTAAAADPSQCELGLTATAFADVEVGPVAMRKLRSADQTTGEAQWELLVSATSLEQHVDALELATVRSLLEMTLGVTVAGQGYLIESYSANEAFGRAYLYRVLLREAKQQAV